MSTLLNLYFTTRQCTSCQKDFTKNHLKFQEEFCSVTFWKNEKDPNSSLANPKLTLFNLLHAPICLIKYAAVKSFFLGKYHNLLTFLIIVDMSPKFKFQESIVFKSIILSMYFVTSLLASLCKYRHETIIIIFKSWDQE